MAKKPLMIRIAEGHRKKLEAIAVGESTTLTGAIERLIDNAPVEFVEIMRKGLALRANGRQNKSALDSTVTGAFAN